VADAAFRFNLRVLTRADVRERARKLGAALQQERGLEEVADALVA
jgi:UDP:flavonoid glycosyltransferase YjiC (YdhE family)